MSDGGCYKNWDGQMLHGNGKPVGRPYRKNPMRDNNDPLIVLGILASAFGGGGDRGNSFPQRDADDFQKGVRFVPGEVTLARRRGEQVTFVNKCGQCCWYWQMPDGSRIYHWERGTFEAIARANNRPPTGDVGPCPHCQNVHTSGGTIKNP